MAFTLGMQMGFASQMLGLAAKISLDLLIDPKRTDEAVSLFNKWLASRSVSEQSMEVVAAKAEATDFESVRSAVAGAAAREGRSLTGHELDDLVLSVSAGLDGLTAGAALDPTGFVQQLNARRGTYAVWLDSGIIPTTGPGRYYHFYWDGEAFRIRDFIGGRIFHPPGRRVSEQGLTAVELPTTALAVWQASRGRVQCLSRYGLEFRVGERERWGQVLQLMTEVAGQWRDA